MASLTALHSVPAHADVRFHFEHDRLHAHLAAALLYASHGASSAAKLELRGYRGELIAHLRDLERFVLDRLAGQDLLGELGWHRDVGRLNEALLTVEALVVPGAACDFARAVSTLREAFRFHCHIEETLLRLVHTEPAPTHSGAHS